MMTTLIVAYDETLVTPEFMAEHLLQLEGVEQAGFTS